MSGYARRSPAPCTAQSVLATCSSLTVDMLFGRATTKVSSKATKKTLRPEDRSERDTKTKMTSRRATHASVPPSAYPRRTAQYVLATCLY